MRLQHRGKGTPNHESVSKTSGARRNLSLARDPEKVRARYEGAVGAWPLGPPISPGVDAQISGGTQGLRRVQRRAARRDLHGWHTAPRILSHDPRGAGRLGSCYLTSHVSQPPRVAASVLAT